MKSILAIILSALLLCVAAASCGGNRDAERRLDMADALMESAPDSALSLLKTIDRSLLSDADAARHALLLSQAYDKTFVDIDNDSLIGIALVYYTAHPEHHDLLARAYYYSGVVAFNARDYQSSIYYLSLADTIAASGNDHHLRALANSLLAWNHSELLDFESEYRHSVRSLRLLEQEGDSARTAAMMLNVAICLLELDHPSEALNMIDSPGCRHSEITRATCLVRLGRLDELRTMMEMNPDLQKDSKLMSDYARSLIQSGNLDAADSALNSAFSYAVSISDSASCIGARAELLKSRRLWRQYASVADRRLAMIDADHRLAVHNAGAGSRAQALLFLANNEKKDLQLRNLRLTIWIIVGSIIIITLAYLLLKLRARKRRSDSNYERQIARQQDEIMNSAMVQSSLTEKVTELEASSAVLADKCDRLSQTNEAFANAKRVYGSETLQESVSMFKSQLESLCRDFCNIPRDDKESRRHCCDKIMAVYNRGCRGVFEHYADKAYGNIATAMRDAGFDEADIEMMILDRIGFSNEEIAVLLNMVSTGAAATRKSRLRTRLKDLPF